jgi:hypothetical protein
MTMSKVANLKLKLADYLGQKELAYWDALTSFLSGRITKTEFEELVKPMLVGPNISMSVRCYRLSHFLRNL